VAERVVSPGVRWRGSAGPRRGVACAGGFGGKRRGHVIRAGTESTLPRPDASTLGRRGLASRPGCGSACGTVARQGEGGGITSARIPEVVVCGTRSPFVLRESSSLRPAAKHLALAAVRCASRRHDQPQAERGARSLPM
jgi:hypothetical protein